jgi:hypothetical protein
MKNQAIVAFNLFAFSVIQVIIGVIFKGYVFLKLWAWFVVPVFHLPQFSLSYAIGLIVIVSFLTHQTMPQKEGRSAGQLCVDLVVNSVFAPAFVLTAGWIIFKITIM